MDKELLSTCIGAAVALAGGSGNLVNKHEDHMTSVIVKLAFKLHDEFEQAIAAREAPVKSREKDI